MPAPSKVHHSKFPVKHILYDDGDFAIAWGKYDKGRKCLGMRWNRGGKSNLGYPKLFQHPVWFVLPNELSVSFIKALLGVDFVNNKRLLQVLDELRRDGALNCKSKNKPTKN